MPCPNCVTVTVTMLLHILEMFMSTSGLHYMMPELAPENSCLVKQEVNPPALLLK